MTLLINTIIGDTFEFPNYKSLEIDNDLQFITVTDEKDNIIYFMFNMVVYFTERKHKNERKNH